METIAADSYILVYRDRKRRWIVRPQDTPKLHTHLGILDCASLVGKPFGTRVLTTMGDELCILKPTMEDMLMKFSRRTQIIYPKELGLILLRFGAHSGSRVLEVGSGSGAATAAIAYAVRPEGHVYSYDVNETFQAEAGKNVNRLGLLPYVTLKLHDAKLGIDEEELDAALVDMGDPWEVVANVRKALRPSGVMAAITPTMNQAEKLVEKMKDERFVQIEVVEILMRNLEARPGMTRPSQFMIGHTTYVVFGRTTLTATEAPYTTTSVVSRTETADEEDEETGQESAEAPSDGDLSGNG